MENFGKYEILERIAIGGMAEILLAQSNTLAGVHRTCVIKRIRRSYSQDLRFVSMFIDEARITIGLEHPNIVNLFDFGQHEGTYYMAMEYVDGTDLACILRDRRAKAEPLPVAASVFIVSEVLRGLVHAHEKRDHLGRPLGIVHRDISPQNLLLSQAGEVKLTDFGIAAARNKLTMTTPGTILGKSAYMAPEQAVGEMVDARADIWAVGVLLYEMLTGQRLFAADSEPATLARVLEMPISAPSTLARDIPKILDDIVMHALCRKRSRRIDSAAEMLKALAPVRDAHPYGREDLRGLVNDAVWADDTVTMRPSLSDERRARVPHSKEPTRDLNDDRLAELYEVLRQNGNLWALVEVGERLCALSRDDEAIAAFRCAAAVFAHRGHLVHALCAYAPAKERLAPPVVYTDLMALADLTPGNDDELMAYIEECDALRFFEYVREERSQSGRPLGQTRRRSDPTPLLGYLAPREFARVAEACRVRRFSVGEVIVREGEPGETLYAIGHGRVVVHTKPGGGRAPASDTVLSDPPAAPPERVYLAALSDGDFFGEFSFLTRRVRSANVEAISDGRLLELDHSAVVDLLEQEPSFMRPLMRFYKERVVELMMAKSPVFCLLKPRDRKRMLENAALIDYEDRDLVVEQGEGNGSFYFIKSGEVEVFKTDSSGLPIFINKLGQGEFFGEIAAVTGEARTVSVRAMGPVSVFRIGRGTLLNVLHREPRLRSLLDDTIRARLAATAAAESEHHRILYAT